MATVTGTPQLLPSSDKRSAAKLLSLVFANANFRPIPRPEHIRAEHGKYLLSTMLDRNFTLITSVGVEFKIHSVMLLGGPMQLQEGLYPENRPLCAPSITFPPAFHPLFMDRFVSFLYTSMYRGAPRVDSEAPVLQHHTALPEGVTSTESYILPDVTRTQFHFYMYRIAEEVYYEALKDCARGKLVSAFIQDGNKSPLQVKELVDLAFETDFQKKLCHDAEGVLKELTVAAVIVHERECWDRHARYEFNELTTGDFYGEFDEWYKAVMEQNEGLFQMGRDKASKKAVEVRDVE